MTHGLSLLIIRSRFDSLHFSRIKISKYLHTMSSTLTSQIASLTLTHPDASSSDILFSPDLISKPVIASLPAGFILRPLSKTDFEKGYLDVLAQLTTVGEISKALFEERFEWMKRRNEEYFVVVLEDLKDGKIAGYVFSFLFHLSDLFIEGHGDKNCNVADLPPLLFQNQKHRHSPCRKQVHPQMRQSRTHRGHRSFKRLPW